MYYLTRLPRDWMWSKSIKNQRVKNKNVLNFLSDCLDYNQLLKFENWGWESWLYLFAGVGSVYLFDKKFET